MAQLLVAAGPSAPSVPAFRLPAYGRCRQCCWLELPLYVLTGQCKGLTRFVGSQALYRLAGRNGLVVLLLAGLGVMLRLPMPPRSSWILLWLLLTAFTGVVLFALRDLLLALRSVSHKQIVREVIYGAAEAGA